MFETSFTSLNTPQPGTQNGNFEFPQDLSLFLAGAWTTHVGSFSQITYNTQDDHFSIDNTDIRYANKRKVGGKELVYGVTLNNNPDRRGPLERYAGMGVPVDCERLCTHSYRRSHDRRPAGAGRGRNRWLRDVGQSSLRGWSNLSLGPRGCPSTESWNSPFNIRGVAPYWRVAWSN